MSIHLMHGTLEYKCLLFMLPLQRWLLACASQQRRSRQESSVTGSLSQSGEKTTTQPHKKKKKKTFSPEDTKIESSVLI